MIFIRVFILLFSLVDLKLKLLIFLGIKPNSALKFPFPIFKENDLLMNRLNSEELKSLTFEPKLKKKVTRLKPWIFTNHAIYDFFIFHEK